jgi:hypothetical protein
VLKRSPWRQDLIEKQNTQPDASRRPENFVKPTAANGKMQSRRASLTLENLMESVVNEA